MQKHCNFVITILILTLFRTQNPLQDLKRKKKIKHVNAETSSHGKMNLGIVLMLNYLLFELHCSLGNYISLKFHQAEQTNKEKNNHIFVAMYQIDNKT